MTMIRTVAFSIALLLTCVQQADAQTDSKIRGGLFAPKFLCQSQAERRVAGSADKYWAERTWAIAHQSDGGPWIVTCAYERK